jgi:hypothetical protein
MTSPSQVFRLLNHVSELADITDYFPPSMARSEGLILVAVTGASPDVP